MSSRRQARECALQVLYEIDVQPDLPAGLALERYFLHFAEGDEQREFVSALVTGVVRRREEIDRRIVAASRNWRIERMARVDRNLLRLAVCEMLGDGEVPPKVVINEAIEIAKRFGTHESPSFVNGILDRIFADLESETKEP